MCHTWTAAVAVCLLATAAHADTRLLRFPDIHGDRVVFTYGGDLWLAPVSGGAARRLTAHPGLELFGKFSPDGRHIAFMGQYGGDEQVYVIAVEGGEPRQLTFYPAHGPLPDRWGYDHQVYGWTPDGEAILFRSLRDGYSNTGSRLYTVPAEGGQPEALPMPVAGAGALSPDGERIVFSPLTRDFRTWKRYEGGWAQELFILHLDGSASQNITNHVRTDRDPMWIGDKIYFLSDRDDYLNVYVYDIEDGTTAQLTRHSGIDARWASDDGAHRIVYELAGGLRVLDVRTGEDRAIELTVHPDATIQRASSVDASKLIEGFASGPTARRLAIVARGEVFSVPVEHGITRNLTATPGAHEREVAWSPDGARVAFISDATGEEELYVRDATARQPAEQITRESRTRYYRPVWSADGKHIAFSDAEGRITVAELKTRRVVQAADDQGWPARDYAWSPDGRWLAYSVANPSSYRSLEIWDSRTQTAKRVTDDLFNAYAPVFSPDGALLYYLSDRMFSPQIGAVEWNYVNDRETGIYALVLAADGSNPFAPRNEEAGEASDGEDGDDKQENEGADGKTIEVTIDFEGLTDRIVRAPIEADNINGLSVTGKYLVYVRGTPFYYGREAETKPKLEAWSLEKREGFDIAEDVQGFDVARDGKHVIVRHSEGFKRYPIKKDDKKEKAVNVATDQLETLRVPSAEWLAMFDEAWRRFRDYFYVENMHGYDWDALRARYRPLVEFVTHRADLNYLLGEMVAELNVGHAYISGGDLGLPERPKTALLGARLELDHGSGRYRFARIFDGEREEPKYRSPLREVGARVEPGDYLLAINGRELRQGVNPYALLQGAADGLVELIISDSAQGTDSRAVLIEPLESENDLIYLEWVAQNRERVARATDGRVGYLHVPDMGANGLYEFNKWFYGQIRKEGLIIDVRGNGGGNVSQMLINRLHRDLIFLTYTRGVDHTWTYPNVVFTGPMVAILDEDSASDGDIFPAAFKAAGLGPLIGKRSWGGVIGIIDHGPLLDGGTVYVPQFGLAGADGQWVIEGYGVDPDIEVDNPPDALLRGEDPQLERSVREVQRLMQSAPAALPPRPPPPVKTPGR